MNPRPYVVMGITGSGKSTVGAMLARELGADFVEGDEYHPAENVQRMSSGIPLTDGDRVEWLRSLAARIREAHDGRTSLVVACSALRRSYRDVLRAASPDAQLIFLDGDRELIAQRIVSRRGHFMPSSLIDSQIATLEKPTADENAWSFDAGRSPREIVGEIIQRACTNPIG